MTEDSKKTLGNVVQIDEKRISDHLGELSGLRSRRRSTVCSMPRQMPCAAP